MEPARSRGDCRHLRRGGTYTDPNVPEALAGLAIAEYAAGLFAPFPDLSFNLLGQESGGDGMVAAQQWVVRGTNTGPLRGNPPTGASVALPGADFIAQEGSKIRSVRGYFDHSDFAEQLGMQVIVSPYSVGPVSFRDSVYLQLGKRTKPAAFSLTSLSVRCDQEAQEVRGYGRCILAAPPLFRLLWMLGLDIPPPFFLSSRKLALLTGTFSVS